MRILLYDNTQMIVRNNRYYCNIGIGTFAKELNQLGHDVTMFGQQSNDLTSTSAFDIIENGIKVAGHRQMKNKFISYLILYFFSIKYIIHSDFVYFFYPTSFRYLPFLCRMLGTKYGLYVRGEVNVNNKLSKILYKKAFVVFTVSEHFTKMVNTVNQRGIGHTIRPMISYTEKDVQSNRVYAYEERLNILFLCRLQKEKGVEELLEALHNLMSRNINKVFLTIVGGGPYMEKAKEIVKQYKMDDNVCFAGFINDEEKKKNYYLNSDIYILPSYNEGFPRTLYEAMIFGTPIITTFVGGVSTLMENGFNCLRIEPHSSKSIEEALEFSLNNYEEMGRLAKNATQTVLKVLDPQRLSHAEDVDRVVRQINK